MCSIMLRKQCALRFNKAQLNDWLWRHITKLRMGLERRDPLPASAVDHYLHMEDVFWALRWPAVLNQTGTHQSKVSSECL